MGGGGEWGVEMGEMVSGVWRWGEVVNGREVWRWGEVVKGCGRGVWGVEMGGGGEGWY